MATSLDRQQTVICLRQLYKHFRRPGDENGSCEDEFLRPFASLYVPTISKGDYLELLVYRLDLSAEVCVVALVYIDRILRNWPKFGFTEINFHRVLAVCSLIGLKFLEDWKVDFNQFSCKSGISVRELLQLEVLCLRALNWRVYVSSDDFQKYAALVFSSSPRKKDIRQST